MHDEVGALGNICGSEQRLEVAISDGCPQSDFSNERRIPDDEIRLRPLRGAALYITPDFDPRFLVGHRLAGDGVRLHRLAVPAADWLACLAQLQTLSPEERRVGKHWVSRGNARGRLYLYKTK